MGSEMCIRDSFTFVDAAGDVITVVTQQELAPVILAALEGAGIGGA